MLQNFIARVLVGRDEDERDERGATATEYGLLVGFIAIAIVAGVGQFGSALNDYFNTLATWVATAI